MSDPSDKAKEAAIREGDWYAEAGELRSDYAATLPERALDAAHDPALGLDRSVCLRDVVERVRRKEAFEPDRDLVWAADFIEREFNG